jgi:hypothetical protein
VFECLAILTTADLNFGFTLSATTFHFLGFCFAEEEAVIGSAGLQWRRP